MASQAGFVGTIEVETRGVSRIWFSLTEHKDDNDWIEIGGVRAWFTMSLESGDRPSHMAQLSMLTEAMQNDLHVLVSHGGVADFHKREEHDTFEANGIRVVRSPLRFN